MQFSEIIKPSAGVYVAAAVSLFNGGEFKLSYLNPLQSIDKTIRITNFLVNNNCYSKDEIHIPRHVGKSIAKISLEGVIDDERFQNFILDAAYFLDNDDIIHYTVCKFYNNKSINENIKKSFDQTEADNIISLAREDRSNRTYIEETIKFWDMEPYPTRAGFAWIHREVPQESTTKEMLGKATDTTEALNKLVFGLVNKTINACSKIEPNDNVASISTQKLLEIINSKRGGIHGAEIDCLLNQYYRSTEENKNRAEIRLRDFYDQFLTD